MEKVKCFLHPLKSVGCMRLILSIINEIEKATGSSKNARGSYTSENANKNLLHFFVFFSSVKTTGKYIQIYNYTYPTFHAPTN